MRLKPRGRRRATAGCPPPHTHCISLALVRFLLHSPRAVACRSLSSRFVRIPFDFLPLTSCCRRDADDPRDAEIQDLYDQVVQLQADLREAQDRADGRGEDGDAYARVAELEAENDRMRRDIERVCVCTRDRGGLGGWQCVCELVSWDLRAECVSLSLCLCVCMCVPHVAVTV